MKPHYRLVNGKPAPVGRLLGRMVMLVPVERDLSLSEPTCGQCTFHDKGCPSHAESEGALGLDCTALTTLVYKSA